MYLVNTDNNAPKLKCQNVLHIPLNVFYLSGLDNNVTPHGGMNLAADQLIMREISNR